MFRDRASSAEDRSGSDEDRHPSFDGITNDLGTGDGSAR
jgi:hypothetical protein